MFLQTFKIENVRKIIYSKFISISIYYFWTNCKYLQSIEYKWISPIMYNIFKINAIINGAIST